MMKDSFLDLNIHFFNSTPIQKMMSFKIGIKQDHLSNQLNNKII